VTRPLRVGLVGCVKGKKDARAPAKDLYISPLFRARRRYVERSCDRWFILSAKHGLVEPTIHLEPYDFTLKNLSARERKEWSKGVLDALHEEFGDLETCVFEIHAGNEYRSYGVVDGLRAAGSRVEIPTAGLRFGEQLAFYASS